MAKNHDKSNIHLAATAYQANLIRVSKKESTLQKVISALFVFSLTIYIASNSLSANAESSSTKNFNIPASPLSKGLSSFAGQNGINLSFDPVLTEGKETNGLKGAYGVGDGFKELLKGTGLQIINDQKGGYLLEKSPSVPTQPLKSKGSEAVEIELSKVKVRAKRFKQIGPMPGLDLTKEQIAGNIQSISAKEIKEAHSLSLSDLLNSKLQSVNVNDYQGNPFQMDVTYRGFTAGPQIGTPQGLSVFFDGVRVNEPFGDVVNWDMIPMNAISGLDIFPGSNPLFGLNTLGGSFVMKTKSGFTDAGVSAEVLSGSYGRKQLQASGGWNNANKEEGSWDGGDYAAFGAVNLFLEDGWRDNSPSKVNQAYGKLEWQGERTSLSFSALGVTNKLVGNGTVPQELYREDPSAVFTSPDETKNRLMQFKMAAAFDVNDHFNITGQVYNRNSKRRANTGDIIDLETFQPDGTYVHYATRLPGTGEDLHCAYADDDADGVPNYFKITEANYFLYQQSLGTGTPNNNLFVAETSPGGAIPDDLRATIKQVFADHVYDFANDVPVNGVTQFGFLNQPFNLYPSISFTEDDGTTSYVWSAPPVNLNTCQSLTSWNQGMIPKYPSAIPPATDQNLSRDGAIDGGPGVVEGTPTAIITDTDIQQNTTGAAIQFNWNYDTHKFMVGASLDKSRSSYLGKQRLGQMDDSRNVFNDPSQLGEEYYFADHDATINDFSGTSDTKSLYFSETWTPTQTLNLSFSGRYNETQVINKLSPSVADRTLTGLRYLNRYAYGIICPGTDLSNCPYSLDKPIDAETYFNVLSKIEGFNNLKFYDPAATEKFSFYSFNPALGATWQAKSNLNLYANWNQGTRAPSVIELGCAYDGTLVDSIYGKIPRSLLDGRGCKLPSALSGDPFLPQVKAQTYEAGARGKFNDFVEWNVSAYRTNVRDDIYMTTIQSLNFFQSIGDTRRQGIEFGLAGEYGKSDFRINYSLTEATFQSNFLMSSENNSSRNMDPNSGTTGMIQVKPGNVMPGVPFNNLNFNWGYKFTPKFKVNLSLVAHSRSYLRGNENNAHAPSPGRTVTYENGVSSGTGKTQANQYSGTAPGYGILNMNTRYDLGGGWAASLLVNNVLDKKYYTAGRLGVNPIAPSNIGAIGPGGFNYNSNEWIPSQFISAGAPRGVWASVSYDFDASKKSAPPRSALTAEPNLADIETPGYVASAEELALAKQIDQIKPYPVLKDIRVATQIAEQEVTNSVEIWRKALIANDVESYFKNYADNYAPIGDSHNHWAEQQKMQFVTARVQSAELNDLVVVDQGKSMVAYFNETISREGKQTAVRKVLTYEQKQGKWQIVRESILPARRVAKPSDQNPNLHNVPSAYLGKFQKTNIQSDLKQSDKKSSTVVAEAQ